MPGICAAERRFSLAKRKCGIGLVTAKLRETAAHVIAMSVLVLNLRKIQCAILQLLAFCRHFSRLNKNGPLFSSHYLKVVHDFILADVKVLQPDYMIIRAHCRYFSQNCVYMYGVVPSFSHRLQYSVHNNVKFTPGRANSLWM